MLESLQEFAVIRIINKKLKNISYLDTKWELENLVLGEANLIVGKNASGKSRTLSTIDLLVKMITQRRSLNWGGKWSIKFENDRQQEIQYDFKTSSIKEGVTDESIKVDGKLVLKRTQYDEATIISDAGVKETVYPPFNKLVLHNHRDVRNYPFLEDIASWAENSYGFKFGNISPFTRTYLQEYDLLTSVDDIPFLLKSLDGETKLSIVEDFNSLGYHISSISLRYRSDENPLIFVMERDMEKALPHYKLSQGMFRSLALIIFLDYLIAKKKPATVIIDDLCEGLDYERATNLTKLVFSKCANQNIQLIATSNDSFLMDVIDISHWNVLHRSGKKVRCINNQNYPELIEKFRFTGMGNFAFFSSDFLKKNKAW